jgi:hypothetical protein
VDDALDVGVSLEELLEARLVADIQLVALHGLAEDLRYAFE